MTCVSSQPLLMEQDQALSVYFDAMLHDSESRWVESDSRANSQLVESEDVACEVLLIRSAGLTFGLPWSDIAGVVPVADNLQALPASGPSWLIGMLRHDDREVLVIDAAGVVVPNISRCIGVGESIVLVGDGSFGFVCEVLHQVTLRPEDVVWRQERETRAWLLGTSQQPACALVDPQKIINDAKQVLSDWLS